MALLVLASAATGVLLSLQVQVTGAMSHNNIEAALAEQERPGAPRLVVSAEVDASANTFATAQLRERSGNVVAGPPGEPHGQGGRSDDGQRLDSAVELSATGVALLLEDPPAPASGLAAAPQVGPRGPFSRPRGPYGPLGPRHGPHPAPRVPVVARRRNDDTEVTTTDMASHGVIYAGDDYKRGDYRFGKKGNPVVWTLCVTYTSLTVLAVFAYYVLADNNKEDKKAKAPKPELGLPAGYTA